MIDYTKRILESGLITVDDILGLTKQRELRTLVLRIASTTKNPELIEEMIIHGSKYMRGRMIENPNVNLAQKEKMLLSTPLEDYTFRKLCDMVKMTPDEVYLKGEKIAKRNSLPYIKDSNILMKEAREHKLSVSKNPNITEDVVGLLGASEEIIKNLLDNERLLMVRDGMTVKQLRKMYYVNLGLIVSYPNDGKLLKMGWILGAKNFTPNEKWEKDIETIMDRIKMNINYSIGLNKGFEELISTLAKKNPKYVINLLMVDKRYNEIVRGFGEQRIIGCLPLEEQATISIKGVKNDNT
jgi:hypothetical protein